MSVREGEAERDRAIAEVEVKRAAELERGIEVIRTYAAKGKEFSANDVRQALRDADVDPKAGGALFGRAVALGIVRRVHGAQVKSSDTGTHGKALACYIAPGIGRPQVREDLVTVPVKRDPAGRFTSAPQVEDDSTPLFELAEVLA